MHQIVRAAAAAWILLCLSSTAVAQAIAGSDGNSTDGDESAESAPAAAAAAGPGGPGGPGGGGQPGTINTEAETLERMAVREDLTPYGVDLLGERLDLATGSLSFQHVDISIPGNSGLEVAVRRSLRTSGGLRARHVKAFGDWSLDIPSLSMNVATIDGWKNNRCNGASEPDEVFYLNTQYMPWQFWNGLNLSIPGQGSQQVLDGPSGPFSGTGAKKGTSTYWRVDCLTSIQNGPGEGFLVTSPDGTKYTFDRLVYEDTAWVGQLERDVAFMLATRVEDRHGNYVTYAYTGSGAYDTKISSITSNDGRTISFSWTGDRITSISANGRTWTYTYTSGRLTKVALPGGLFWTISVAALVNAEPQQGLKLICGGAAPQATGYIVHPYGARGDYTLNEVAHGRTKVPYTFISGAGTGAGGTCLGEHVRTQRSFDTMSLTQKKLTGPGLPTMIWNYTYQQTQGGWTTSTGVSDINTTSVVDPEGHKTVHHFDRTYTWKENAEVKTQVYQGTSTLLQTVDLSYVAGPVLGSVGATMDNQATAQQPRSLSQQVTTRGSDVYTSTRAYIYSGSCYDYAASDTCYSYGNPVATSQSNSFSPYTQATTQTYQSNRSDWVLGLPRVQTLNSETAVSITYDADYLPVTFQRWGVTVATRDYYANGLLNWEKNANNHQVTFSNYYRGMPRTITYPDSLTRTFLVDYFGNVTRATDRAGNETNYNYDSMDRLTLINYPDETGLTRTNKTLAYATVTSTDLAIPGSGLVSGQWKQTVTRGDHRVTKYLDAMLRPLLVRSEDTGAGISRYSRTAYDSSSQPTFSSFPSADADAPEGSDSEYDALGRLLETAETVAPYATTSYAYGSGNTATVTNPRGKQTTTTYFALGSPAQELPTLIVQPESVTTTITRNNFGEMTAATQAGGGVTATRTYRYDSQHRLCRQVDPETGSTAYSYNNANQLEWYALAASGATSACNLGSVTAGQKALHTYNSLGQLTNLNYPDSSPDLTYGYDLNGNLTSLTSSDANWTYVYNAVNALKQETLVTGGQTFNLAYGFDTQDLLTSITYPSGQVVSISPNAYGAPESVGSYASGITYHPNGALHQYTTGTQHGTSRQYTLTQNERQLPYDLTVMAGATTIGSLRHTYDANANILGIADNVTPAADRTMTYDDLDRLKTASGIWGSGSYTYDALGNLKTKTEGGKAMTYVYNTSVNRLTSITGAHPRTFSYDSFGNVAGNGIHGFTYNRAGNLVSSTVPSITYKYDGHKRRVQKTEGGQTGYTVYNQAGQLMHKLKGGVATDYIYAGSMLLAEKSGSTIDYMHTDLLGSPIKGTNGTSYTEHYTPWGEKWSNPVQLADDVGYTGHQSDVATGLTYMQARYYDPVVGRFMAVDPLGFGAANPMSFSAYSYVNNNPFKYVDPTGEVAESSTDRRRKRFEEECSSDPNCQYFANFLPDLGGATFDDLEFVAKNVIGMAWTSPNTAVGLVYGLAGHAVGLFRGTKPKISLRREGPLAVEFQNSGLIIEKSAITFGNVIVYDKEMSPESMGVYQDPTVNVGRHEEAHVIQYQRFGALFLPIYLIEGDPASINNGYEKAANEYGAKRGGPMP